MAGKSGGVPAGAGVTPTDAVIVAMAENFAKEYAPQVAAILGLPPLGGIKVVIVDQDTADAPLPDAYGKDAHTAAYSTETPVGPSGLLNALGATPTLTIARKYARANLDDLRHVVAHELTHLTLDHGPGHGQTNATAQYGVVGNAAWAFNEGLSDYVAGLLVPNHKQGTDTGKPLRSGYEAMASYIGEQERQFPGFIKHTAMSLSTGTLSPDSVQAFTGVGLRDSIASYRATLPPPPGEKKAPTVGSVLTNLARSTTTPPTMPHHPAHPHRQAPQGGSDKMMNTPTSPPAPSAGPHMLDVAPGPNNPDALASVAPEGGGSADVPAQPTPPSQQPALQAAPPAQMVPPETPTHQDYVPQDESEQFLLGPTSKPDEHVASGLTMRGAPTPPPSMASWLPILHKAAQDPDAPPQLKVLVQLILSHSSRS